MVGYAADKRHLTANLGDRISHEPQTVEEKAKQLAVDAPDITGDYLKVPTYFIVNYPDGETKALHHVRDAQEISKVIRQMHLEEEEWVQQGEVKHWLNMTGLVFFLVLFLLTAIILIGIF